MADHLATRIVAERLALEVGLERVLHVVAETARSEFGSYQPAIGGFPEWPELADSTKEDRASQGYTENDPLYRTGATQKSIATEVDKAALEGGVGSEDEKMLWFEMGTSKMPARPVLGPAAFRNKSAIQKLVGAAAVAGLIGEDQIHAALGYDFET